MLIRDGNILHIIGLLRVSMRLETRWPHVIVIDLHRNKPEKISLQKEIEIFTVQSLSLKEIFNKQHTNNELT